MDARPRRTRLYVFPGGVLEMADYGDGDSGGVYLESRSSPLPQRVSSASDVPPPPPLRPIESADAEMCGRVLRSLRGWEA